MIPDNPIFSSHESRTEDRTKRKRVHPLWWILQTLVVIYATIGFLLYYLQDWLLFHPEPVDRTYSWSFSAPHTEVEFSYNGGDTINLVKFAPLVPKRGVMIYFHGNRENIARYVPYVQLFTKVGYEVWMPDYPGYGKSTGKRSEDLMYLLADVVYRRVRETTSADSLVLYGKSMGTALASYLASKGEARKLILETPYPSIPEVMSRFAPIYPTRLLSHYQFPVREYLKKAKMPALLLHGTDDGLIPIQLVESMRPSLKPVDRFVSIAGGEHNTLPDSPVYQQEVLNWLE